MGAGLTARELEVLQHAALGRTGAETAALMVIAVETVKSHRRHIVAKLGARNMAHALSLMSDRLLLVHPERAQAIDDTRAVREWHVDMLRKITLRRSGSGEEHARMIERLGRVLRVLEDPRSAA